MFHCRIAFVFVAVTALAGAPVCVAQSMQVASAGYAEAIGPAASSSSSAEAGDPAAITAVPRPRVQPANDEMRIRPFSRIAFGSKLGTLGWGGQIATPITRRINLRGGADIFNLGYGR